MLFFRVYQYLGPVILLPLTYWLWWQRFEDHRLVFLILSIPIVTAYIVPGLGTNWLKLWDFQTRWKLGRFRPHHGLLFGSAASMFALICLAPPAEKIDLLEVLRGIRAGVGARLLELALRHLRGEIRFCPCLQPAVR